MGREVKRVPMDFDWPQHKVWRGYISPYQTIACPYCAEQGEDHGSGLIPEAKKYYDTFYNVGYYIDNPYDKSMRYNPIAKPYAFEEWEFEVVLKNEHLRKDFFVDGTTPTYEEWKDYYLRNERRIWGSFEWEFMEEFARRNNIEDPTCPHCKGEGYIYPDPSLEKKAQEWRPTEPPTGDGYQLWETTSEGSPVSPVFKSLEELAEWCETNATTFANDKATKEQWMEMFKKDFIYSQIGPNAIAF